jgi:AraC-like DNA-binding protein
MHYQKYPSSPTLIPFIECYFNWEGDASEAEEVQSPPNGYTAIVFNLADPYWGFQAHTEACPVPMCFASGQFTSNYHLLMKGKIGIVGIVFKATALNNFFHWNMVEMVNQRVALEQLLGKEAINLYNAVHSETTSGHKITVLDNFLMKHIKVAKSRLSLIDDAAEIIDNNNGMVTIESVANQVRISRRYLEKRFLEKVGISPKLYARVRRFSVLSNKVAQGKVIDWQDMVLESGYHDQSHLVKEFKEFNQMNPRDYHQKHLELIRFVNP